MSSHHLAKLSRYIPLWQRRIPEYPLYVKGNPQLRIYLPLFWMKMLKWDKALPKDTQAFEVHQQMTDADIKNYLEQIYKVKVLYVQSELTRGETTRHPMFGYTLMPGRNKRIAFIQLGEESANFTFPEIFKSEGTPEDLKAKEFSENMKQAKKKAVEDWQRGDLPPWF